MREIADLKRFYGARALAKLGPGGGGSSRIELQKLLVLWFALVSPRPSLAAVWILWGLQGSRALYDSVNSAG